MLQAGPTVQPPGMPGRYRVTAGRLRSLPEAAVQRALKERTLALCCETR